MNDYDDQYGTAFHRPAWARWLSGIFLATCGIGVGVIFLAQPKITSRIPLTPAQFSALPDWMQDQMKGRRLTEAEPGIDWSSSQGYDLP
ncbi:hypothetical protein [Marinibacterium sp. SX1]|uniref:hypothetical protein n=1 Tax=Marinibacterium sp. SX1 TaxID=3388424 RepID=UPI003D17ED73